MKLNIPHFIALPSEDYQPFPASIHVPVGRHRVILTGKLQSHSINTGQCMFKMNFDAGGPTVSTVRTRQMLLQGDAQNLGHDGSLEVEQTGLNEQGSITGVEPTVQLFITDGIYEVTAAGELSLLALVAPVVEGPAEVVTFTDVQIEVTPI